MLDKRHLKQVDTLSKKGKNSAKKSSNNTAVHLAKNQTERNEIENFFNYDIPSPFQGHTFSYEVSKINKKPIERSGPFRIEYFLCTEFLIHLDDLRSIEPATGFSNLKLSKGMTALEKVDFEYPSPRSPRLNAKNRTAQIALKTQNGILRAFVVIITEQYLTIAIRIAGQLISNILDTISFLKQIPLQVRHFDIFQAETNEFLRRYQTIPYSGTVNLEKKDLLLANRVPKLLVPSLRLFREAISSTKPHYRLLCLCRVLEDLNVCQEANNQKFKTLGISPTRPRRCTPDNDLTRKYFPDFIGKSLDEFLSYIKAHYNITVPHLDLDEYERLLLDPADMRIDHRIDYTTAVLISVVQQMIKNEWTLMSNHGLI